MRRPHEHRTKHSFTRLRDRRNLSASPSLSQTMNDAPRAFAPLRLLVIPGLRNSGPAHWQSWLQARRPGAVRVIQRDWACTDLQRWSARIDSTLARSGPGRWLAVAHSFGVLALVEHLARAPDSPIAAALLVAPADPGKFGLCESLPHVPLHRPASVVASSNDPWMSLSESSRWATRWGCPLINLGAAGHINAESGHGALPLAEQWLRINECRLDRAPAAIALAA
jgi:predicted alpha/beta hydrolase family esterase